MNIKENKTQWTSRSSDDLKMSLKYQEYHIKIINSQENYKDEIIPPPRRNIVESLEDIKSNTWHISLPQY